MPHMDNLIRTMNHLMEAVVACQFITGHAIAQLDRDHLENRSSEFLLHRVREYADYVQSDRTRPSETLLLLQHLLDKNEEIVRNWRPDAADPPYDP